MTQKERNELSRARILVHASVEFAEHGYHSASVNRICEKGKVSKGLMYHYFKNKDDLYLACVKKCYSELTKMILQEIYNDSVTVDEYFDRRAAFFEEYPVYYYLYLDSITNCYPHIHEQLQQCRTEYDTVTYKIFTTILNNLYSDTDIDIDFALTMLTIIRSGISSYIETKKTEDLKPADHSKLCKQIVHTVIRGLP